MQIFFEDINFSRSFGGESPPEIQMDRIVIFEELFLVLNLYVNEQQIMGRDYLLRKDIRPLIVEMFIIVIF